MFSTDCFLVPTPYYAALTADFGARNRVEVIGVNIDNSVSSDQVSNRGWPTVKTSNYNRWLTQNKNTTKHVCIQGDSKTCFHLAFCSLKSGTMWICVYVLVYQWKAFQESTHGICGNRWNMFLNHPVHVYVTIPDTRPVITLAPEAEPPPYSRGLDCHHISITVPM